MPLGSRHVRWNTLLVAATLSAMTPAMATETAITPIQRLQDIPKDRQVVPPGQGGGTASAAVPGGEGAAPPDQAEVQAGASVPAQTKPDPEIEGKVEPGPTRQPGLTTSPSPRPDATSLLDACWDPQDLLGRPGERKIRDHLRPDHRPPERQRPLTQLAPLSLEDARSLRSVDPTSGEKLVALTFDLCEQADEVAGYDGDLVDTLRAHGTKATFYAGGKWMRSHPQRTMQLMADPLFEIGNHAWTHGNLRVLQGAEMEHQIDWTQAEYELLRDQLLALPCAAPLAAVEGPRIPPLPATFRFPYGTCNSASLQSVAAVGLYPVQWNIVSGDPAKGQTAARIVKGVLAKIRPGSIVVAHANGRGWHTAEALKTLIPALQKLGYRFVTVSELLQAGPHITADLCYELREGDNFRYDRLFGKGTQ